MTAFTIGHSLTLLVGTFGWLRLPPRAGRDPRRRVDSRVFRPGYSPNFSGRETWVAAGFGLVHGLAFASALPELHLDATHLVIAVLGFNLGIEAMQLAVIALTFPWLLLLARTRVYALSRIGGAVFAAIAAAGWIARRAFHVPNGIDDVACALAGHPRELLASLVVLAISARALSVRGTTLPDVAVCSIVDANGNTAERGR